MYQRLDSASGNLTLVNAKPCTVNAVHVINGATASFTQIFDAAATTDVTLGTTIPAYVVPAGAAGVAEGLVGADAIFRNGIVIATTTTVTGSSTLSANFRCWVN